MGDAGQFDWDYGSGFFSVWARGREPRVYFAGDRAQMMAAAVADMDDAATRQIFLAGCFLAAVPTPARPGRAE